MPAKVDYMTDPTTDIITPEILTRKERAVMCHALGLQLRGKMSGSVYRNHYVDSMNATWEALRERGLAECKEPTEMSGGGYVYRVTNRGCEALLGIPLAEADGRKMSAAKIRAALEGDTTDQAAAIVELRAAVAASSATAVTLREALFNVVDAHDAAGSRNTDERLFRAIETARGRLRG